MVVFCNLIWFSSILVPLHFFIIQLVIAYTSLYIAYWEHLHESKTTTAWVLYIFVQNQPLFKSSSVWEPFSIIVNLALHRSQFKSLLLIICIPRLDFNGDWFWSIMAQIFILWWFLAESLKLYDLNVLCSYMWKFLYF